MRVTVIDIGTNTMLMLIGDFDSLSSQIFPLADIQRIPRLGKGVDANRNIQNVSINIAVEVLKEYTKISEENLSNKLIAVATSFLRDANNKYEFIEKIKNETGIDIEILSGDSEAQWSYWGAVYGFLDKGANKTISVIDIGGGSTEISRAFSLPNNITRKTIEQTDIESISLDIGSVRIKERFFKEQPPSAGELENAEKFINEKLDTLKKFKGNNLLIGTAGTITTLAAIDKKLTEYDSNIVDNHVLTFKGINKMYMDFSVSSIDKLLSMGSYMQGRADVILPGTMILKCFMEKFEFEEIHVSAKGLRYGIFLRENITF